MPQRQSYRKPVLFGQGERIHYVQPLRGHRALQVSDSTLSASLIGQPYGVAVDSMKTFFTDCSENMIALICGSTASGFCSAKPRPRLHRGQ